MNEEQELIARARRGDAQAYGSVVRHYEQIAFRVAYLITRDEHEAADAAQDAFLRAYRALGSFKLGQPVRPWLLRIVTNVALNRVKSSSRRERATERYQVEILAHDNPISPEHVVAEKEQNSRLERAVQMLAVDDQLLLSLRFFLELSESEVAATMNLPLGTVKSRLYRTLARLRVIIQRDFPDLGEVVGNS